MQADIRIEWFSLSLNSCSMSLCNRDIGSREEAEGAMKNEMTPEELVQGSPPTCRCDLPHFLTTTRIVSTCAGRLREVHGPVEAAIRRSFRPSISGQAYVYPGNVIDFNLSRKAVRVGSLSPGV